MWKHPCVDCMSLKFLVWRLFLIWMPDTPSSGCVDHYPLTKGCDYCCMDWSLHHMFGMASSLLCSCYSPAGSVGGVVGVATPRSGSKLWWEVGGIGTLLLGKEPLSKPLQGLSTGMCTLWYCLSPIVHVHKVNCCWHCPWLHPMFGNTSDQPGHRPGTVFTKVPVQIHWNCTLGPAVGALGISPDPSLTSMCRCLQSPLLLVLDLLQPRDYQSSTQMSNRFCTHKVGGGINL